MRLSTHLTDTGKPEIITTGWPELARPHTATTDPAFSIGPGTAI